MLVLSLFPGIGLLDTAFEEEGFCVVRGPDLLWGGDIRTFHPPAGKFDGVIGGPPCQRFSSLVHLVRAAHGEDAIADNLIPEFERVVQECAPTWFVMENVPKAPLPSVYRYRVDSQTLKDAWVGGETSRTRVFSFGSREGWSLPIQVNALCVVDPLPAVCGGDRVVPVAIGKRKRPRKDGISRLGPSLGPRMPVAEMLRRQGAPLDLLDATGFTVSAKRQMVGNGVPLPMGRAIARAVKAALAESRLPDVQAQMEGA